MEPSALEEGVAAIEEGVKAAQLIVLDEIGKMEFFSPRFREAVLVVLDSGKPVLRAVMLAAHPFADAVKRRADVEVVALAEHNRAQVEAKVLAKVRAFIGQGR